MATTTSAESLPAEALPVEAGLPPVKRGELPVESEELLSEEKLLARAQAKEEWWWIERAKASSIQADTPILLYDFSNIYQLLYLELGFFALPEATALANQLQVHTDASYQCTVDLADTLLISTIDLQYYLVHKLFSIERQWFWDYHTRTRKYKWVTKAWAEGIIAAETESERMKIWTPMLKKETSAMTEWMEVFSAILRVDWIFPNVFIMDKDEEKKLLRERLQHYFTMKFILTVEVVFVKLVKPVLDGEAEYDHKTIKNLYNPEVSFLTSEIGVGQVVLTKGEGCRCAGEH
jgi:hypothetical protein